MPARAVSLALSLCLLAGCTAAPIAGSFLMPATTAARAPRTAVLGTAAFGAPLVGATVQLLDGDGQALGAPLTTDARGGFYVDLPTPSQAFMVVVSGGMENGQPFGDELRAAVTNYGLGSDPIAVNAVSTLIAAFARAHPALSPADAEAAVRSYLDLGEERLGALTSFDAPAFAATARQQGGLAPFLQAVLTDMEQNVSHPYPPAEAAQPKDGDQGGGLEGKVVEAVVALAQWGGITILKENGVDADGSLALINRLDAIIRKVELIHKDVINAKWDILNRVEAGTYETAVADIKVLRSHIDFVNAELKVVNAKIKAEGPAGGAADRAKLLAYIDSDMKTDLERWKIALTGNPGQGALPTYNRLQYLANRNCFGPSEAKQVQANWEEFDALQAETVAFLAMAKAARGEDLKPLYQRWAEYRANELAMVRGGTVKTDVFSAPDFGITVTTPLTPLPPGVVVDKEQVAMFRQNNGASAIVNTYAKGVGDRITSQIKAIEALSGVGKMAQAPSLPNVPSYYASEWTPETRSLALNLVARFNGSDSNFVSPFAKAGIDVYKYLWVSSGTRQDIAGTAFQPVAGSAYGELWAWAEGRNNFRGTEGRDWAEASPLLARPVSAAEKYWF